MSNFTDKIKQISPAEKKMLKNMFKASFVMEHSYNYERQQGLGFSLGMWPAIREIYDNKEDQGDALERHLAVFNATPHIETLIMGIAAAMEKEASVNPDFDKSSINAVKVVLMGPLAGVGDSLIHGTLRPIMAGLACSMAAASGYHSAAGPILFILVMTIVGMAVRYVGIFKGYEGGLALVANLQQGGMLDRLTKYAGIAAFTVCGGFISALVYVTLNVSYVQGDTVVALQEVLDDLMPNLIPLLYTLLMYYLIDKKKVNIILLMVATICLGCLGVVVGIL